MGEAVGLILLAQNLHGHSSHMASMLSVKVLGVSVAGKLHSSMHWLVICLSRLIG